MNSKWQTQWQRKGHRHFEFFNSPFAGKKTAIAKDCSYYFLEGDTPVLFVCPSLPPSPPPPFFSSFLSCSSSSGFIIQLSSAYLLLSLFNFCHYPFLLPLILPTFPCSSARYFPLLFPSLLNLHHPLLLLYPLTC